LENKLEKMRQKHNESLAEIRKLIEVVNANRRERVIFDNVFKNLEHDLKHKEEEFKKYLFENLQVEKERKIAEEELEKIKIEAEREIEYFNQEYEKAFSVMEENENNTKPLIEDHFEPSEVTKKNKMNKILDFSINLI
jgi:hypothetical protein